jgi:hypothetical protein
MARSLAVALITLALVSGTARADIANIQLGDDYFRIRYVNETLAQSVGRMELDMGYLYSNRNSTSDYLLHLGAQVRNDPVVARHHTVIRPHLLGLAAAHIGDLDPAGGVRIAQVPGGDHHAVEANPGVGACPVETVVRQARGHRVVQRRARQRVGNHGAHEQPGQRRVAVGKVDVRSFVPLVLATVLSATDVGEGAHGGEGL